MQSYPPSILVDAGPLIALYRQRDTHHRRALEFAGACSSDLFTTWPVLTEAAHFLNERGRLALLQGVERGAYAVIELGLADVPRMGQILAKYPGADLADASLIIAAERLGVTDLATLDRTDFSIYRTRTGRAFVNHF
jgi:uncharacterized protein